MNLRATIGMFDSGVGGLTVTREVRALLPDSAIVYVADQAHVPYGGRPAEEVRGFAEAITRFLLAQGAEVIVVASNTTSAAALTHLRETFPETPIVGMEPAIKPAVERTKSGVVGVLATEGTLKGDPVARLLERFSGEVRVLTQACPGLVDAVENGACDKPATEALLREYLAPLQAAGIDQLVFGCTHYPFLRRGVERILGPGVRVIDPAPAVARQLVRVLTEQKPERESEDSEGTLDLCTTGAKERWRDAISRLLPTAMLANAKVSAAEWKSGVVERRAD